MCTGGALEDEDDEGKELDDRLLELVTFSLELVIYLIKPLVKFLASL